MGLGRGGFVALRETVATHEESPGVVLELKQVPIPDSGKVTPSSKTFCAYLVISMVSCSETVQAL